MNLLNLIEKAKAEGADVLASPTFPFSVPGSGSSTGTGTTVEGRSILLETDTTSVNSQQKFIVRIKVNSDETEISGFTVSVDFDPDYLQVVDADTSLTGTQIDYQDTTFEAAVNIVNNTSGLINLRAETEEGQTSSISRTVAEIEFVALEAGTSEVTITETNSNIISTSGVDVLDSTNSIKFNISTQAIDTTIDIEEEATSIPKTGISDNLDLLTASIGGILLITTGLYIRKLSKRETSRRH